MELIFPVMTAFGFISFHILVLRRLPHFIVRTYIRLIRILRALKK